MADIKHILGLIVLVTWVAGANSAQAELVAYYPFDGDLNDYSGNSKNGVYWSAGSSTATPTFVTGKVGQAISLHEFASYDTAGIGSTRIEQGVILPDESYFDFAVTDAISIACWVKFNSVLTVNNQGWFNALITKSRASDQWSMQTNWNTGAQRLAWRIGHTAGATSTFSVRPGTTDDTFHLGVDEYDNPAWDTWYHVVTTYDGVTGWSIIYLDGQWDMAIQQSTSLSREIDDRNNIQAAAAIGIYAKSDYTPWGTGDSYSDSHDGLIDEVAIYDNALTPEEVATIYTEGPIYCGMTGMTLLKGDISGPNDQPDCYIDLYDLAVILENWLECTDPFNPTECPP